MRGTRCREIAITLALIAASAATSWAIPEGPADGTPEWTQREQANYARTDEAPSEQAANPQFQLLWNAQSQANHQEWVDRALADPSWLGPPSGNSEVTPLSATWGTVATGDPTRYPAAPGPNGADFYANEVTVVPVVFYDEGCARISGRVWAPKGWQPGDATLPGVVIENGSIQAPETLYWWFAHQLVRAGYEVLTFDPRGQGRSDFQTPTGEQGGNTNSEVFYSGMVNAIDFFRSTPALPYPHDVTCAASYPTVVAAYNPLFDRLDHSRLGIAGHSLGASGVSSVAGYAGEHFAFPADDGGNPVDVMIAWDSLRFDPDAPPRVPAMGETSEYGLTPAPFTTSPDPESDKSAYQAYAAAGVPVYQFTIQGSTHYEWSLIPGFPTTSWCPDMSTGSCLGGWGHPMAEQYSLAWMDRWLKRPGESGYGDADTRLLADADWCERYSFYLRSARSFPDRNGGTHHTEDIRAECLAGVVDAPVACGPAPRAASECHATTQPGRAKLQIKDQPSDRADQLKWSWRAGDVTPLAHYGDPVGGDTSYTLCVWDHDAGTPSLVTSAAVPAGGICDGKPCWKSLGAGGFKYADKTLAHDGVKLIRLKPGATPGKAQVGVIAKGPRLGFTPARAVLPLDQSPKVTVQLSNSDGRCWTADYSAPASKNDARQFKDVGD